MTQYDAGSPYSYDTKGNGSEKYLGGETLRGEPLADGDEGADELLLRRQPGRPARAGGPLAPQVVDGGDAALEAGAPVVEGAPRRQVAQVQPLPRGRRRGGQEGAGVARHARHRVVGTEEEARGVRAGADVRAPGWKCDRFVAIKNTSTLAISKSIATTCNHK